MKIEASFGEVADKATILSIKLEKFVDEKKKNNVNKEYAFLISALNDVGITENSNEFKDLKEINLKLWDVEDKLRIKESKQEFDEEFINLARSVYFINDERARIKKKVNEKFHSSLIEEKEYVDYNQSKNWFLGH